MPSRVAEILLEQGRAAARAAEAKGAVWGGTVERLGQIPGEFVQQQRQQQRQGLQDALARQDLALGADRLRTVQDDRRAQALLPDLVRQHTQQDPASGHTLTDHQAVMRALFENGLPKHAEQYGTWAEQNDQRMATAQKSWLAHKADVLEWQANFAGGIAALPEADQATAWATRRGHLDGITQNKELLADVPVDYPGAEGIKKLQESFLSVKERLTKQKEAAEEYTKGLKEVGVESTLVSTTQIDPTTGLAKVVARGAPKVTPKHYEQKSVLLDGKPAEVHFDPATGQHLDASGADVSARVKPMPPPSIQYPRAPVDKLIKVEHKGADGRTVIEWLPQSEVRGQTFNKGVGSTMEARLDSAQAVNQTGEDMIAKLSDPAYAAKVGPALGRFNTLREFIGNPPPEFAELAGMIESYSLANMGVHGMRSAQGAQLIAKLMDQHHTPQSIIAAIKGLNAFSTHFLQNEGRTVPPSPAAGPSRFKIEIEK